MNMISVPKNGSLKNFLVRIFEGYVFLKFSKNISFTGYKSYFTYAKKLSNP